MTDPPTTRMASPSYSSYTEPTSRPAAPSSGLSEDEARGFHNAFIMGFAFFTIIAAVAHFAVWNWRPWIPGTAGYPAATSQTAPATQAPVTVATNVQR
jgi:light-harvesting complex 1 beta chain